MQNYGVTKQQLDGSSVVGGLRCSFICDSINLDLSAMAMKQFTIRLAQKSDQGAWDAYVNNHTEASPYHLWAWGEAVADAYNHQGYYLVAEQDSHLCGVLPLIHMKLSLLQNQLISLPFCDLAGPLADSDAVTAGLEEAAVGLAGKLGVNKTEIRTRPIRPEQLAQSTQSINKVSMVLELPSSTAELWDGFKSKLRSQVRRAEKNGLSFAWGNATDTEAFYSVFSKNMHELGSPVHSKQWIKAVCTHYGNNARMGLVFSQGLPIGCGIILCAGNKVAIPWASTLRTHNKFSPNMLLYWNLLKFSADNGYKVFDFGRSTPGEGTYRFKQQWGAVPVSLCWRRLGIETSQGVPGDGPLRRLVEKIWQRLPDPVANGIGPRLRKYIDK